MSMSIGVITGFVALGGLGIGYYIINSKNTKSKKSENEIIIPYTRPAHERIKFAKVNTDVKTTPITSSTTKKTKIPSKTSNAIHSHNTYDDDFYPVYHDYGSNSHSSSHDSHSSYDSGGSYDSGSCDCGGCD